MPARPMRVKILSELGIPTTLPEGGQYLQTWGHGPDTLILCPGPNPALCLPLIKNHGRVFFLHLPDFAQQMPSAWHQAIPPNWQLIDQDSIFDLPPQTRKIIYTPIKRLFPSCLAPILAQWEISPQKSATQELWLPSPAHGLIVQELASAAQKHDLTPRILPATIKAENLAAMLNTKAPALFVSINFQGLDAYGENQALLEAAGVPIAVWCVDNPFHLLTAQKNILWKKLPVFVTDSWFIHPLKKLGAHPIHLPLATDPLIFASHGPCPRGQDLLFVGRSHFPDRDSFFAAATVPKTIQEKATTLSGRQAHFGWWQQELGGELWPGNQVRSIGLGAEIQSQKWRAQCLSHLAHQGALTIIGDANWANLVPEATLTAPVDYYHGLAQAYSQASLVLNLTSLLLPHGLTQRHFDVWACGSFLLTDHTQGLDIFPGKLAQSISFETPEEAWELARYYAQHPKQKEQIRQAWQKLILQEHSYSQRLQTILHHLGCGKR